MAQHDYVVDNQTAPNFRADLNSALSAIVSTNSGTSAPATTYANMMWYDTTNNILYMRNEADDGWVPLGTLDQVANTFAANVALASQAEAQAGTENTKTMTPLRVEQAVVDRFNVSGTAPTYACRAWVNFNGTGTIAIRAAGNVSSITDNGTGDYTVNLTTAMPDANYCVVTSGSNDPGDATYRNTTNANRTFFNTTSFPVLSQAVNQNSSQKEDAGNINVAVFR